MALSLDEDSNLLELSSPSTDKQDSYPVMDCYDDKSSVSISCNYSAQGTPPHTAEQKLED